MVVVFIIVFLSFGFMFAVFTMVFLQLLNHVPGVYQIGEV